MNLKNYSVFFIILFIVLLSCSDNKISSTATGLVSEIAVCAPVKTYALLEECLLNNMYKEMFLPVRESVFKLRYIPLDKLHIYKKSKNILFIVNVNRDDKYSEIIKGFLSEENLKKVHEDKVLMFNVFDGFADGQNILIIAGVQEDLIEKFININAEKIQSFYMESSLRSIKKMVYFTGFNDEVENDIKQKLNINIKVPSDYVKSFYDKQGNGYSIISHSPERIVTVYKTKENLNSIKDIISFRNKIAEKYWDNDYVDTLNVPLLIDTIEINGEKALQIIGVWGNSKFNYGGPFLTIVKKEKDYYLFFDGHIFYPGKRKYFKLMETKVIIMSIYDNN